MPGPCRRLAASATATIAGPTGAAFSAAISWIRAAGSGSTSSQPDESCVIGCRDHDGLVGQRVKCLTVHSERGVETYGDPPCTLAVVDIGAQRLTAPPIEHFQGRSQQMLGRVGDAGVANRLPAVVPERLGSEDQAMQR